MAVRRLRGQLRQYDLAVQALANADRRRAGRVYGARRRAGSAATSGPASERLGAAEAGRRPGTAEHGAPVLGRARPRAQEAGAAERSDAAASALRLSARQ